VKDIRTSPPADLFEEILELQDTLDEYRAADRDAEASKRLHPVLQSEQRKLEERTKAIETQLRQRFTQWDELQDRGEATNESRSERERLLKEIRDLLSHRTYIGNIVRDLVATIE
jgi:molecular chaperone HscB